MKTIRIISAVHLIKELKKKKKTHTLKLFVFGVIDLSDISWQEWESLPNSKCQIKIILDSGKRKEKKKEVVGGTQASNETKDDILAKKLQLFSVQVIHLTPL